MLNVVPSVLLAVKAPVGKELYKAVWMLLLAGIATGVKTVAVDNRGSIARGRRRAAALNFIVANAIVSRALEFVSRIWRFGVSRSRCGSRFVLRARSEELKLVQ
jgi:hypothetical protein